MTKRRALLYASVPRQQVVVSRRYRLYAVLGVGAAAILFAEPNLGWNVSTIQREVLGP